MPANLRFFFLRRPRILRARSHLFLNIFELVTKLQLLSFNNNGSSYGLFLYRLNVVYKIDIILKE